MLRLCKTLIKHILHKKSTVDVNVLGSRLVDVHSWIHNGCSFRTCHLLPALCHLEFVANGSVSSGSGFTMPKTKRKHKHKKSKHSRRHKKAKITVPEVIQLSSSSDSESDLTVVFDLKQERLRVANENIVNVPDSDNEDIACEKIIQTEVDLVSDTGSLSNEGTIKKEKETVTADMGNTISEGVDWNNIQNFQSGNVENQQVENVPVSYAYGLSYTSGNVYAGNVPAGIYMPSYVQGAENMCPTLNPQAQTTSNVYAGNVPAGIYMSSYVQGAENMCPTLNPQAQTTSNVYAGNVPAGIYMSSYVQGAENMYPTLNPQAQTTSSSWSSTFCKNQSKEHIWDVVERQRRKLKKKRRWEQTVPKTSTDGKLAGASQFIFTIMSYNVLAQDLIHQHDYLYYAHNPHALNWEVRSQILMNEIREADAQVLCLQEVQENLLDTFYKELNNIGYKGIYKQRTGNNVDGVAIYYKSDVFDLVDYTTVEYFQPNVDRLNRDNVGLVAKLACKVNPDKRLVVATTHLLFNPRRHDVKLSQIQILLAEVERFAFDSVRNGKIHYWPVIITGDMNFLPYSGVYRLLTEGVFRYEGRCSKTLQKHSFYGTILDKKLIPDKLQITDTCQHWGILCNRMVQKMDHKEEIRLLKIHNSDHQKLLKSSVGNKAESEKKDVELSTQKEKKSYPETSECPGKLSFGTGKLSHPFSFRSVYRHGGRNSRKREVTTNQNSWVTVDYIFYSVGKNNEDDKGEDELKLVARYKLLTEDEAERFGPIPNFASPSDHYPLLATFLLKT